MSVIVPDVAEPVLLTMIQAFVNAAGLHVRLYKNNYIPVDGSTLGNFTEADFSGYASVVPTMTVPTEVSNKAEMHDNATRHFTHNGGGTGNSIYGYYVTLDTGPALLWAERFSAPITMATNGDDIAIIASFTLDSEVH